MPGAKLWAKMIGSYALSQTLIYSWKKIYTDMLFFQRRCPVYRRSLPDLLRHANRGGIIHGEYFFFLLL